MATISKAFGDVERRIALRTLYFWFLVHLVFALFLLIFGQQPFVLGPAASLILVGIVFVISVLAAKGNNEDIFLANLGSSTSLFYFLCLAPGAVLELVLGIAA